MFFKIFPAYGLENSLLTAILVGLYIRFFFTEWLGWVFSGLVVPGYLACIFFLQPASALVIITEAALTFAVVRGMSNWMSRTGLGSPLFGRNRFVWLVVASVGVRVAIEALVAPWLEWHVRTRFGWDLSDSFGFYGIGLVLVPLLANACWKPGLLRGSFQQIVCTGLTFLLILGLLHTTNLSFAKVAHAFEQTTLDFTASPKAYLLLLAGVLVASHANLRFGWDTSGVVIPGLLALAWFTPGRVLATIGEALLIVIAATLFMRLPRIRDWNIEGPRRVVLLFTFGYIIKFFIVAIFGDSPMGFEPTALFGIGYLLPSLLAVKILQRRNPLLIVFPSITLSLVGLFLGSLAGYALLTAGAMIDARRGASPRPHEEGSCGGTVELVSELRLARARTARTTPSSAAPRIAPRELRTLANTLRQLRQMTSQGITSCSRLAAQTRPGSLGLRLQAATSPSGRSFIVLSEHPVGIDRLRGFGVVALATRATGGPLLIVERPEQDVSDLGALATLIDSVSADAIVIGGLSSSELGRGDVRRDRTVALRSAAEALGGNALTLRTQQGERPRVGDRVASWLVQTLEAKLGPLPVGGAGVGESDLMLTPEVEQRLAAPLVPALSTFANRQAWLAAVPVVPRIAPLRSPSADLLLAEDVIRPLARAHTPVDLTALGRSIAGPARELGLTVSIIDGDGARPEIALHGQGEGLLVQPSAPAGALIEVVSRRRGVAELSAAIFEAQAAHALLIAVTIPGAPDSGPLARVAAPLLALTPPLPPAIVVRSETAPGRDCSIVFDTPTDSPPMSSGLSVALASLGIRCESRAQYDVDSDDPPSQIIDLLRARTKRDFVTLQVGAELRERFRPASLSTAQLLLFTRLKIPAVRTSLERTLTAVCATRPGGPPVAIPPSFLSDLSAFTTTRNPSILERLRAQADRTALELQVIDDQDRAEVYLLVTGIGGAAAVPLRPAATSGVSLPCSGDVSVKVRKAQAMGAASIAVGHSS